MGGVGKGFYPINDGHRHTWGIAGMFPGFKPFIQTKGIPMKAKLLTAGFTACAILTLAIGCKKEEPTPPPAPDAPKAEGLSSQANQALGTVKTNAQALVDQATTQAAVTQDQAQGII